MASMNKKIYNHLVDVAFTVEGPWERYEDIPFDAFIEGLQRRVDYLRNRQDEIEAFGDCFDKYLAEKSQ